MYFKFPELQDWGKDPAKAADELCGTAFIILGQECSVS